MGLQLRCFLLLFDYYIVAGAIAVLPGSSSSASTPSYKYWTVTSSENDDDFLSQKDNILEKSYHGLIREKETSVEITPLIRIDEKKICNFQIVKKPYHEVPLRINWINNLGVLKAHRNLNCEKRKSCHAVVVFYEGTHSAAANVHITVIDVNYYAPTFLQPSYVTEADERLYKEEIRVEAIDKDCAPLYGDVKYQILNQDQPFSIDNEGSIKNTEPLSHKISHNFILPVVSFDCAMKQSKPIMVSVKVRSMGEARFLGIPECIDYTASSTESLFLFPSLELCGMVCDKPNLSINIVLKTKHISFCCDLDISICSRLSDLIDLLPRSTDWTMTIFCHFVEAGPTASNRHIKVHIICNADNHKMNRHHMALFVRNCRLILLLRKNINEGDVNIFTPAEWRWKIPQACDTNSVIMCITSISNDQKSKVDLYIDGLKASKDHHSNPEVIDDWPLHAAHCINTTLTVGAENHLKQGFNGDILEIKILLNRVISPTDSERPDQIGRPIVTPAPFLVSTPNHKHHNFGPKIHYEHGSVQVVIKGNSNNLVTYPEIKCGVHILGTVNVSVIGLIGKRISVELQLMDTYSVIVFPSLNPDHEEIEIDGDETLFTTLDIKTNINKDGVEMIGTDSVANYLSVLKALVFSSKKPAYYLNRIFKVVCSQLNLQCNTGEFTLTLTVLHPKQIPTGVLDSPKATPNPLLAFSAVHIDYDSDIFSHVIHDSLTEPKSKLHSADHKTESSHPTTLIIPVWVFSVILLSRVSIAHLKSSNNHKYAERHQPCLKIADEGLTWNEAEALTNTINHMQGDAISYSEILESEDEVVKGGFANINQLEWDNSNIFIAAGN
ncbi:LOW QUALITY PROTEIN: calsyntenin 1 [Glossina fuscipes fuscipes]